MKITQHKLLEEPKQDYSTNKERQNVTCIWLSIKDETDTCRFDKNKCSCAGKKKKECCCRNGVDHKHYK